MRNKVKDIKIKTCTYLWKFIQKYSYLLYWICDDQRFEIPKYL